MDVRKLFIILKHTRDPFERSEIKKELLQKLMSLTEEEAKYILTLIENYIDTQKAYSETKDEQIRVKELVKQINKILNI